MQPPVPRRWRPGTALQLSFALHAAAGAGLVLAPASWPLALGAVAANQAALTLAGLLPRSRLLGPNLTRLPAAGASRGEVSITIDDGPDPAVTPRVLDLLDAAGARASFFCIGREARSHPGLLRQIAARGHSVENHGMNHLKRFAALGPAGMRREIADAQQCLADLAGRPPRYFRPTAGLRSPLLEPQLCRLGLHLASWTRRGYDTRCGDPDRVYGRLARHLAAGDILLLHDGNAARSPAGQPVILEVLPRLLDTLGQAGLRSLPLPDVPEPSLP